MAWRNLITFLSPAITAKATAEREALTQRMPELDGTARRLQQAVEQLSAERATNATLQASARPCIR